MPLICFCCPVLSDFETKVTNQSQDSSSESEKDVAHDNNGPREKVKPLDKIPNDPEIQIQMFFSSKSNPVKKKVHVSKSRSLLNISLCTFLRGNTVYHS